ncbi:EAL domain-containing protein [Neptuniibacter sp.]|uniref:EAL domain-containing protein n=1 Tax=Neptuniibacter sp. TaxID=1962643 RepID=UPI00260BC74C|nr:EAL domain-containing protein [Neptuniibacter sp.]MCP4594886.1 EAL domain-containing protein [Neptuniibacter sp.]
MSLKIFPYFQPIVETATGCIAGYEALARMEDEQGNIVSAGRIFADQNIPVKERIEIDRDVRLQALQKLSELPENTYLSINISPEWLQYLESLDNLPTLEMMKRVAGDPSRIVIEITELDGELEIIERLAERYREQGFKVAIDDFGTGFSQLDRIALLKPDIIKLDMSLLRSGALNQRGSSMVQMLGEMASKLGSKVLCEGVETEEEYYLALSCNAVYVQGFLFSQATEQLQPPESTNKKVKDLLSHYRDRAIDATSRNHWRAEKVKSELLSLREVLRAATDDDDLQHFVAANHLLRFYICDRQGNQISPNYENSEKGWIKDERHKGYNWSWRPYFFELLGSSDTRNRMVFSEPYQDIHSGQRAQTAVLFIDDKRILLADLLDEQQEQDLFSGFGGMPASWIPEIE